MAHVVYTEAVLSKLRRWATVATVIGFRDEYSSALRELEDRLRADPESWGEPIKDFRSLRLTLYHRYGQILVVKYAVHIDGTPVFVRDVELTPRTPLYFATD